MACCCPFLGKRKKLRRRKVTLLLVGLDNAGKTTAIRGIEGEPLDDITPTIGFTYIDLQLDNFDIKVYDLGGGRKIRGIWKNYYAEVHGVVFVIDASAEDRLKECQETLEIVLNQEYVRGKRVLILANKQDQEGALDEIDICDQLDLETMVNNSKCPCRVETCSAIQGSGKKVDKSLRDGFRWLLSNISSEWEDLQVRVDEDMAVKEKADSEARKARLDRARKTRDEREKREAEERKARGEEEEQTTDVPIVGDPFKKVDKSYFEEQAKKKNEEKKKKSKKQKNGFVVVDNQNKNAQVAGKEGDHTFVNEAYIEDNEKTGMQHVVENGDSGVSTGDVVDATSRTEPDGSHTEAKERKKKKGKKLKKNKVEQSPAVEGEEDVPPPGSPRPLTTPAWAAPANQRPVLRASQRPGLETLPEQHNSISALLPPIGDVGSNRNGALPEIRPVGAKPNSEEDEGVVT